MEAEFEGKCHQFLFELKTGLETIYWQLPGTTVISKLCEKCSFRTQQCFTLMGLRVRLLLA